MRTTKRHFIIFKKECEKWIKAFGLLGHKFYYTHEEMEGCIAQCTFPKQHEDRVFTLSLNTKLNFKYTIKEIKMSAFHEVMESFLYRIRNIANCRYIAPEEVDDEIHNIIRTLEKTMFMGGK